MARLPGDASLIVFDERGKSIGSEAFAELLRDALEGARSPCFAIGGPDGHGPPMLERADHTLAFGKLTMPHQIVRALVLEQIYRATTILTGHPYHRA